MLTGTECPWPDPAAKIPVLWAQKTLHITDLLSAMLARGVSGAKEAKGARGQFEVFANKGPDSEAWASQKEGERWGSEPAVRTL